MEVFTMGPAVAVTTYWGQFTTRQLLSAMITTCLLLSGLAQMLLGMLRIN